MTRSTGTFSTLIECICRAIPETYSLIKIGTLLFILSCIIPIGMALRNEQEPVKFGEKAIWIQVGNQIRSIDDSMFQMILDCGFNKVILLNSAMNESGYFPLLASVISRCHPRGISVSMGDLVFKEVYLRDYWKSHQDLRKMNPDGSYADHPFYKYQICPNNPRNQEYIAEMLVENASNWGVDEIHVDYECTACYCAYCVTEFKREYGKDARFVSPEDNDWRDWRSKKTSRFFKWLAMKVRHRAPDLRISATAPIIGRTSGFTKYGIDLRYEDLSEYVDEFVPMIYISECLPYEMAGSKHRAIQGRLKGDYVVPGLMLGEERTNTVKKASRVKDELKSVYRAGARGLVIFEVRFINDEIVDILKAI